MYSLSGILPAGLRRACGGGIFLARVDGQTGGATMRKCWYPLWIFTKNRVIANGEIGA